MVENYPFMNDHWEDKRVKLEQIKVPVYVLARFSSGLHTIGSLRGFEDICHENKW